MANPEKNSEKKKPEKTPRLKNTFLAYFDQSEPRGKCAERGKMLSPFLYFQSFFAISQPHILIRDPSRAVVALLRLVRL